MKINISYYSVLLFILLVLFGNKSTAYAKSKDDGILSGNLKLDKTWSSEIYLSYIPTFENMYIIANDAIISKTNIDSVGNYSFDISFLPEEDNLFRLHIVKKGDAPNTLIIGGKDENHLFLLANCYSTIEINSYCSAPPFRNISFRKSNSNNTFWEITNLTFMADSIANESSNSKKRFIENQLHDKLRYISDTCSNPLISLYAIYCSNFEDIDKSNVDFHEAFLKKWKNQKNSYFEAFRKNLTFPKEKSNTRFIILLAIVLISISFYFGKWTKRKQTGIKKLSVQERKVLELLKKGATNQEISEDCHIGISTVKSHVSSIFVKLNIKSRKEAMNMK
jgi:DNA-binding CsgD family transcriptional regulator